MRGQTRDQDPTVVYLAGWGRSGSTLLERLLGELPGVTLLGEVVHLWERGLHEDQLCACGAAFSACPFWTAVGARAFGGWQAVDLDRLAYLRERVDRQRRMPRTARRRPDPGTRAEVEQYAGHFRAVYAAAQQVGGARVLVDSSKEIPTALTLSHRDDLDLRVLHVVRDARGVAYSWAKTVARPEAGGEPMPRFSPARSTGLWLSGNLTVQALAWRGVPLTRMRYEDLVADPAAALAEAWRALDLPGSPELPVRGGGAAGPPEVDLGPCHSVAGNPMRFRTGPTELRADEEWRAAMAPGDRRLVTAMAWPLLRRFGYR
ncbi:sulfotransferase [Nocardioides campestrisoli]|uniref:sulfotransferase n=1 Tax=Nocardioides campestrisoli TaxID=2736757 RepID=UPI0015E636DB|nr:sulfotransferase [Nocardioides campestrisoli]